ncbi:hypothetical protein POM88_037171 [Heracleum sosnowskyi]|uniref:Uncharacterized protein n=1 Tax=Heracleum sosnowskyi TaxID=360622 RepID=A0AAD8HPQ2_9APIA|nr:hypothetical protein POM88_037171 [Heracleum sosnowskyi]
MPLVTGDRYLESLVKFVDKLAGNLIDGTVTLKLNPIGLNYVQSRLEALSELESLLDGAPVDYLRAYIFDLGDHRALEQYFYDYAFGNGSFKRPKLATFIKPVILI